MHEDIVALGKRIAADRLNREPFLHVPELDVELGYEVQDAMSAATGPVGGYKIAWNSPGLPERFGVSESAAARVFAADVKPNGSVLLERTFGQPMLEPEIAVYLARDIPARKEPWSGVEIEEYLGALHPAFEVLDRRGVNVPHGPSIIAGGVFNAGAVVGGEGVPYSSWQNGLSTLDLAGERLLDAVSDTAPEPVCDPVARIVNLLAPRGAAFEEGMLLLCGSHRGLLPITAGQTARFEIEGLGAVVLEVR